MTQMRVVIREELSKKNPEQTLDVLLTRQETADLLKVHPNTVSEWAKHGILNKSKMGNRDYYKRSEIFARMEELNNSNPVNMRVA